MRIILIRHGIAIERDDAACPAEAERYLTPQGIERTHEAMAGLRELEVEPDLVLSSPYVRALETARIACEELGHDPRQVRTTTGLLPSAAPRDLLREVAAAEAATVICCGHAPHLDEVLAHAVGAKTAFTALKKAGAACLEFDELRAGGASLVWLFPVGTLRKLGA